MCNGRYVHYRGCPLSKGLKGPGPFSRGTTRDEGCLNRGQPGVGLIFYL